MQISPITPEDAALIAQVYPTLTIALMLEGRYAPGGWRTRWVNLLHHVVRFLAITGAMASTFACLRIAVSGQPEVFTDWMVEITRWLLLVAFTLLAANVLGEERDRIWTDFQSSRKSGARTTEQASK